MKQSRNITEIGGLVRRNATESKRVKKLLQSKYKFGIIAWHRVAEIGRLKTLEILRRLAKEAELMIGQLVLTQVVLLQELWWDVSLYLR
jgi:hypothetical protein